MRVSSTSIQAFLDCPRKYAYNYVHRKRSPVSFAMAAGTVFHVCMEHRVEHAGELPRLKDVWAMEGNYDPPRDAIIAHPGVWELALKMAAHVPLARFLPMGHHIVQEISLEEWNLTLGGYRRVTAGGYIDVLDYTARAVRDWKTRGSFDWAPRTRDDFLANTQLAYYAGAVLLAHPDWPDITMQHINVLRSDEPRLLPIEHTFTRAEILERWHEFDTVVVPAMHALHFAETTAPETSERDTAACFKYGPCPHRAYCRGDAPATPACMFSFLQDAT